MKKGLSCVLLLCAGLLLAGCGKDDAEKPERVSGSAMNVNYRGVEYEPYDTSVTEEEIGERLQKFLRDYANLIEVTDRTQVQNGDTVNIDYTGYMDGETFRGGSDTDVNLEIGSNSFIPGFESGLIGAEAGTTVDVNTTFPDPYRNNPDFSGKTAVFRVTIHKIYIAELPELTDELVAANTDYETVAAYRDYIRESLKSQKEGYADNFKRASVMNALIDGTEFTGIEQADIDKYFESSSSYYSSLAEVYEQIYGLDFDMFISEFFACSTREEYEKLLRENAEREVKKTLILYAVAEAERLSVSDEEYSAVVQKYAAQYKLTEEELLEQVSGVQLKDSVLLEKAEQLIYDTAVARGAGDR
ncbi:MAG: trigger factor [Lachnospiraceae bacterium]|nr:trigger factor [Lachnospiraceae bacterium]